MAAIEGETASVEAIRQALEGDLARILALQAAGKALTARDRGVLEREMARQAGAPEPEEARESNDLVLEDDLDGVFRWATLKGAADAYGYSLRQIKNWKKRGWVKEMPCPFDRPGRMPAWFEAVYAPRECPQRLQDAVQKLLAEGPGGVSPPEPAVAPVAPVEVREDEVGFEATLRRARRREALLDRRLQAALDSGDPRADAIETQWGKAASRVRELEKAAPAILEAQGVYLRREDVRKEWLGLVGAIPRSLKMGLVRRRQRFAGAETLEDFERVVGEVMAEVFRELCGSGFAEPLELEMAG